MPTIAPDHDPDATGPRDWRELRAMRSAHAAMPHAEARAALDRVRLDTLNTARKSTAAVAAARAAYATARQDRRAAIDSDPNDPQSIAHRAAAGTERAAAAIAAARSAMRTRRAGWQLSPCPVDAPRCTGHATIRTAADARALRHALRAARPLRRDAGRILPAAPTARSAAA